MSSKPFKIDATMENGDNCPDLLDSCIDSLNDCLVSECLILEALHHKRTNLQERIKQLLAEMEDELNDRGR